MFHLKPSHLLVLSCLLLPVATRADEDTRVQKTVLLDKITFKPVAEAKPDEIALRDKNDIYLSPDAAHIAVYPLKKDPVIGKFVLKSGYRELLGKKVILDGKAGPSFQSVTSFKWDKVGNLFYIGQHTGNDYIVQNFTEFPSTVADEIRGLSPLDGVSIKLSPFHTSEWDGVSAIYAKRMQGAWQIESPNIKVSKGIWDNIGDIWAAPSKKETSIVYEVTDAAGKVALLRDGESLGGPRSVFDGAAVNPVWSPDGKHIAYCVKNGAKDYLCVDGKPISIIDRAPQFSWSPSSSRVVVWGNELKTFSIVLDVDGKPTPGNAIEATPFIANKSNNGIAWSHDGMHWGFFAPASGDIYVDGVKKVSIPKGNEFLSLLALDEDASTIAYSYKNGDTISVKAGDYEAHGFKAVHLLRFNKEGKEPLFLAQKDEKWSLHIGNEDIVFLNSVNDKTQPLTDWLPQGKGIYRIVMLEEEAENSKVVRYDITLGR